MHDFVHFLRIPIALRFAVFCAFDVVVGKRVLHSIHGLSHFRVVCEFLINLLSEINCNERVIRLVICVMTGNTYYFNSKFMLTA